MKTVVYAKIAIRIKLLKTSLWSANAQITSGKAHTKPTGAAASGSPGAGLGVKTGFSLCPFGCILYLANVLPIE